MNCLPPLFGGFVLLGKMCENARMIKRNSEHKRPFTKSAKSYPAKRGASAAYKGPAKAVHKPLAASKTPYAAKSAAPSRDYRTEAANRRQQAFLRQGSAPKPKAASAPYKGVAKKPMSPAFQAVARKPLASAPFRPTRSVAKEVRHTSRPSSSRVASTSKKFSAPNKPRVASASWGSVASWYDKHLSEDDTYHQKVILPNLLRLVDPRRGETIVDLACGSGYFAKAFAQEGAVVTGIDISEELIAIARKAAPSVSYHVGKAEDCPIISNQTKDKVVIVLAIQNIEHVQKVFAEAARMLKPGGTVHLVMNHPAFRIPKQSSWEYDDKKKVQYRRIDQYMSESTSAIDMHPGMPDSPQTISYHRPLQYYFKALTKAGFAVDRLEEWISHKDSDSGPRARAENSARKEIPLFLYLSAKRLV